MKVIDCVTYNGEKELFEIRYNILKDFVDEFRVVEFDKTFSGKPKKSLFNQYFDKVKHYIHNEDIWGKYYDLAVSSPNTLHGNGAKHWITEFCQKESIKDCLTDLKDEAIVFIGDCDEIWNPLVKHLVPIKLKLQVYSYWLDNKSTEQFWGTIVSTYKDIKEDCLNHRRGNLPRVTDNMGWHFTSMGGVDRVKKKLTDCYTEETYAHEEILNNLEENINQKRDFLWRDFSYKQDESEWPDYLKKNKEKYKHLIK